MANPTYDATNPRRPDDRRNNVGTASGLNIVAAIWLIIAPFVLGYSGDPTPLWNDIICGIVGIVLAAIRLSNPLGSPAPGWLNAALGVWLIIAPFALGYAVHEALVNDIVLGVIFVICGLWSAAAAGSVASSYRRTPHVT